MFDIFFCQCIHQSICLTVKIQNLSNPFLLPNSSLFFDWMLIVERETSSAHFLLSHLYIFTLSFTTLFLTQIPLVLDFLRVSSAEKRGASRSKNRALLLSCNWHYSSLGHTEFGASGSISVAFRDSSLELLTTTTFLLLLATQDVFSASECYERISIFFLLLAPCFWTKLSQSRIPLHG